MSVAAVALRAWQALFCRRRLFRLNRALYALALRGMGILNYESDRLSGEHAFLARFARLGGAPTVLDVGAHEGSYAAEVARLVPGARVFAFEPHPATFERLSAAAAGRYTPVRAALGSRRGTFTLYDRSGPGSQHASLVEGALEAVHRDADVRRFAVDASTVDDFVRERGIARVHLLKVDTEGSEIEVLRGARGALEAGAVEVIQLEFNAMNAVSRVFMRDLRALLPGYTVHRLLPDGPVPLDPYDPVFEEIFAFQNVLFVSPRLDARAREVLVG